MVLDVKGRAREPSFDDRNWLRIRRHRRRNLAALNAASMPDDNLSEFESVVEVYKVTLVLRLLASHERANFIFIPPSSELRPK
jgi:hypothetical protein